MCPVRVLASACTLATVILMIVLRPLTGGEPVGTPASLGWRGVTMTSWWHDEYLGTDFDASLSDLKAANVNWGSVLVTWYMDTASSNAILPRVAPDEPKTPSDAAVRHAIRSMKNAPGHPLRVMLKPHVDVKNDAEWRGAIHPSDPAAWFNHYRTFILHYARLAAEEGVELLCIGTELMTMSGVLYQDQWTDTIKEIKKTFPGQLTYAANCNAVWDEFQTVSFWEQLDYIGVNLYVPLANDYPTEQQLAEAWSLSGVPVQVDELRQRYNKPVLITEIGYQSREGCARSPWWTDGGYDEESQRRCVQAAITFWSGKHWVRGMFWWGWIIPLAPEWDNDFTLRNKPAALALRAAAGTTRRRIVITTSKPDIEISIDGAALDPNEVLCHSVDHLLGFTENPAGDG